MHILYLSVCLCVFVSCVYCFFSTCLSMKRRESSKRNYYIISPGVIIKAIIIICLCFVHCLLCVPWLHPLSIRVSVLGCEDLFVSLPFWFSTSPSQPLSFHTPFYFCLFIGIHTTLYVSLYSWVRVRLIYSFSTTLLHRRTCTGAGALLEVSVACSKTGLFEHQCICRCVRYTGVLTSAYTFVHTLAASCAHALVYVQFVH